MGVRKVIRTLLRQSSLPVLSLLLHYIRAASEAGVTEPFASRTVTTVRPRKTDRLPDAGADPSRRGEGSSCGFASATGCCWIGGRPPARDAISFCSSARSAFLCSSPSTASSRCCTRFLSVSSATTAGGCGTCFVEAAEPRRPD